ncbi:hypothetical protein JW879_10580 [candidate division WOR-3 bacterium]|nr:hypothetical protein [candidate division WOR-3 bacterium]
MYGITVIISLFLVFNSTYTDLTIDSKNRVILLSSRDRIIEDESGKVHFSLDSMFAPLSISASSFAIWVTSASEFTSQKYSLWGEFLGEVNVGGSDIDADEKGILIAGEQSYFVQTVSGASITLIQKEIERCALSKDSLYLYSNDTLRIFKRDGKFIRRKFIPGVKDLCTYNKTLCLLFNDSLVLSDTVFPVFGAKRAGSNDKFIAILSDSGIVYYPTPKK